MPWSMSIRYTFWWNFNILKDFLVIFNTLFKFYLLVFKLSFLLSQDYYRYIKNTGYNLTTIRGKMERDDVTFTELWFTYTAALHIQCAALPAPRLLDLWARFSWRLRNLLRIFSVLPSLLMPTFLQWTSNRYSSLLWAFV